VEINIFVVNILLIIVLLCSVSLTMIGLPGNFLIFLTALGYGYWEGFKHFSASFILVLLAALVVGETVEFVAGALGARRQKASGWTMTAAVLGAIMGAVIGTFIVPFIGSFLGAMGGAFAASYGAEYLITRDADQAKRVAQSVMVGQIVGMIVKFALGIGMVAAIIANLPWY
jgi:uncharacterized protein YqgC (DUF456 family)